MGSEKSYGLRDTETIDIHKVVRSHARLLLICNSSKSKYISFLHLLNTYTYPHMVGNALEIRMLASTEMSKYGPPIHILSIHSKKPLCHSFRDFNFSPCFSSVSFK